MQQINPGFKMALVECVPVTQSERLQNALSEFSWVMWEVSLYHEDVGKP